MTQTTTTQDKESRVSKATRTWIIKNYTYKLLHPDDTRTFNRAENSVKYILRHATPNKELIAASTTLYYKNLNTIKNKLKRINKTQKLKALATKYPKLNIERAYKLAVLHDKLALNADDIEFFENLLIVTIKQPKTKK